jgi:hypothetical protein
MTAGAKPLGPAGVPVVHTDGVPTTEFGAWLDYVNRFIAAPGPLVSAANDAAAAVAGVPLGGLYRVGNAVQVRLV